MNGQRYIRMFVFAAFILLLGAHSAMATTTVTLGDQDYADGATETTGNFATSGAGEPAPFDGAYLGSDVFDANFSATWTFSYAPQVSVTGGSITIGIYDHDSAASGNQVSSFTLNGIDLTADLNTLFESYGGTNTEINVYTLILPNSTFADLASGSVQFNLDLQGAGLSVLGETTYNGAGLDYSTLHVETASTPSVPEPATMSLLLLGLPALLAARRKLV